MWQFGYHSFRFISAASVFLAGLVGALLKTKAEKWGILHQYISWIQEEAWWLLIALAVVAAGTGMLTKWIGPPWLWDSIRRTLNRIREEAFAGIDGEQIHHHRVTLFRRKWSLAPVPWRCWYWPWGPWRVPWSGWMVSVARSGHTTQQCWSVFLAPEEDADNSEGVVGLVWTTKKVQVLPPLPSIQSTATEEEIAEYAKMALMPVDIIRYRVRKGTTCPRSLCGIPVEVDNKIWGVLVLDSRRPDTIKYTSKTWDAFTRAVPKGLVELLRGV